MHANWRIFDKIIIMINWFEKSQNYFLHIRTKN